MSDPGRKDFSTRAKEEVTPDSSKSATEKVKETVTDTKDRIARGLKPDEQKGPGQEAFDKTLRVHESEPHESTTHTVGDTVKGTGDKVKGALGMDK